jgi:hypothetical protein
MDACTTGSTAGTGMPAHLPGAAGQRGGPARVCMYVDFTYRTSSYPTVNVGTVLQDSAIKHDVRLEVWAEGSTLCRTDGSRKK